MKNDFKNRSFEDGFMDYMIYKEVTKEDNNRHINFYADKEGMSTGKAVLITVISFVISGLISTSLGLPDTPMFILLFVLWIAIGFALVWFDDKIPVLKDMR